jgi:hypothetical protein
MINVIVGTTTNRTRKNYAGTTTLREILEDNAVDYSVSQVMLDGANISASDMDRTLSDLGKVEKCSLIAVVKANNA